MRIYSEETEPRVHSIQNLSDKDMEVLEKKLRDQPITPGERANVSRILYAFETQTPLTKGKKK